MKMNLPTLDQEYEIEPGITIVSKTDLRGIITYANDAFITVSGFEREELIGKSHNIVRHPDMPPQAFADMWKTLKSGQPWKGIVKNRRKDGGYYWVEACVVPIRKDDETIGYMSVRQKARPEAIAAAEALYERLRKTGAPIPHQNLKNLMTIRAGFVQIG
ncbi:MAG: PAS domain-containing protein, partial [Zoogloea sp.]|nr:PAS domain-containing protein [Zoogloea sp.]